MNKLAAKVSRPYLFELDLLRAYTAFTVVALHCISKMNFLVKSVDGNQVDYLLTHVLHYNREVFVFITGLVLTYIYRDNPSFSIKRFYKGRFYVVFIPYVLWTTVYTFKNQRYSGIVHYIGPILKNVVDGNASPQLYYIILTIQIYLLFPLFLWLINKIKNYPWQTLSISLGLQLVFSGLDFHFFQAGSLQQNHLVYFILTYQDTFITSYLFFLLLGGLAAVYTSQVRAWYARYGKYSPVVMASALALYLGYYYIQVNGFHEDIYHATSVLQPSVILYSSVCIFFFYWVALQWAKRRRLFKPIRAIADMSFGIFFVHFVFLDFIADHLGGNVRFGLSVPEETIGVIVSVFGLSILLCYLLLKIPFLSWTIGKPVKTKKPVAATA